MKISQILKTSLTRNKFLKLNNPHLEAELLLSLALKKPREYILAHPDEEITQAQLQKYRRLISLRTDGTPLAYLAHCKQFFGYDFYVNKNVLIPRPETELMVEKVLEQVTNSEKQETKSIIIDIGTGSGNIIISLAKEIKKSKHRNNNYKFFAADISSSALAVAKRNAKTHEVDIKFKKGNLLAPLAREIRSAAGEDSKIIITANLPYLTPEQAKASPSIQKEPRLALLAGPDGLKYYHQLLKDIRNMRQSGKFQISLYLEIDESQSASTSGLVKKIFPEADFSIKKDLMGLDRLAVITLRN